MKALPRLADAGGELRLHEGVDILRIGINRKLSAPNIVEQALQAAENLLFILLPDDAAGPQHRGMRHTPPDILLVHPAVKGDGGIEIIGLLIGLLGKTTCP